MAKFYTSDFHFGHVNILKPEYCNRIALWPDTSAMDEAMILAVQQTVGPDDDLYIIGDLAMGDKSRIPGIVARLPGRKHLYLGNHDYKKPGVIRPEILAADFTSVQKEGLVDDDGLRLLLRHEPDMNWVPSTESQYQLVGHVHNSWTRRGPIINVGVDVRGFKPVTLQELISSPEVEGKSHRGY